MVRLLPALTLRFVPLYLFLFIAFVPSVRAEDKSYRLKAFYTIMSIEPSGDIRVTEAISYNYTQGKFSSAHRQVSLRDLKGVEFVSVRSADTEIKAVRAELKSGWSRYLDVQWSFPETDQPRLFLVEYILRGAVSKEDRYNLIDWRPLGDGLPVEVDNYIAEIRLPWSFKEGVETTPPARIQVLADRTILTYPGGPLERLTPFHITAKFPAMIETGAPVKEAGLARRILLIVLPGYLALLGLTLYLWRRVARVSPESLVVQPGEWPDPSVTLGEASMLLYQKSWRWRAVIVAVLFDLARRGFLYFESPREAPDHHGPPARDLRVIAKVTDASVRPWEYKLLNAFLHEASLEWVSQQGQIQSAMLGDLRKELKATGLIDPRRVLLRQKLVWSFTALLAVSMGLLGLVVVNIWEGALAPSMLAVGGSLMFLLTGLSIDTTSARGAAIRRHMKQFARAKRVEVDQLCGSDPDAAAARFTENLAELVLDEGVNREWIQKFQWRLELAKASFQLPTWMNLDDPVRGATSLLLTASNLFHLFPGSPRPAAAHAGGHMVIRKVRLREESKSPSSPVRSRPSAQ